MSQLPRVPYGAVYYRKANPPREDWEQDYRTAAEDGLNIFRHWFMWSAIERRPGHYDFDDCDRQLDLAAQNGMKTIIAEHSHTAPEWAYRKYAHARQLHADGRPFAPQMGISTATGGFAHTHGGAGSLTMNAPDVKERVAEFLEALASRYKGHPSLWGYDVWNEINYSTQADYSEYMKADFRLWLKERYGSLDALGEAWHRYGYAEWEDVEPPQDMVPYPENLDWLAFKKHNYNADMQFKIDVIRKVDPSCLIAAHGVAGSIQQPMTYHSDDWVAADKVALYGVTWVPGRRGFQSWQNFIGLDVTRGAARGKPWWHAERPAGPLWLAPQVMGRDREDGRVMDPEDVRTLTLTSFAAGAKGVLNLRYRPLLDGPLFGAFGAYGMDGSRTPRSDMASAIAKWANAPEQATVFGATPVSGDIAILVVPESQDWDYLLNFKHRPQSFRNAVWGAYRGFFDNGIQADFVHIDHLGDQRVIYAPYPIMLTAAHARILSDWVAAGGTLISEATPGYFGDRGRAGTTQPHNGLDAVFGAREIDAEFMPDIAERRTIRFAGHNVTCGGFLQVYEPTTGKSLGTLDDSRCAVVENSFGKGRTLLVGTHAGMAYFSAPGDATRAYFAEVLAWSGQRQRVAVSNNRLQARLHEGPAGKVLWLLNTTRKEVSARITVDGQSIAPGQIHWPASGASMDASMAGATITVPSRDGIVMVLT